MEVTVIQIITTDYTYINNQPYFLGTFSFLIPMQQVGNKVSCYNLKLTACPNI